MPGRQWRLRPNRTRFVTSPRFGYASRPNGQLTAEVFHLLRSAALLAAPGPSLPGLRGGNALVVRPLHRYYSLVRLLIRVHAHRSAFFAFMSRTGMPCRPRMRPPRFRAKNFSTCTRSSDWARFPHASQYAMGDVAFSASERDRHLGIDRFAAQYLARGLPCERFTAALASRTSCITRGWDGWLNLSHGRLSPPILCQLAWRTRSGLKVTQSGPRAEHRVASRRSPPAVKTAAGHNLELTALRHQAGAAPVTIGKARASDGARCIRHHHSRQRGPPLQTAVLSRAL
jgi:hypothetical protein